MKNTARRSRRGLAATPRGVFEGYASLFSVPDSSGDIVMPGAFAASLARRRPEDVRMLFQHDPAQPVGRWLDIHEDARGLYVRGQLSLDVQRASELCGLLRDGAIDGLSIGFRTILASRPRKPAHRKLLKIDLWEISLVTFPMLAGARVSAVKAHRPPPVHAIANPAYPL